MYSSTVLFYTLVLTCTPFDINIHSSTEQTTNGEKEVDTSYIQRDIDDMNSKINELHSVVADLDGIVQKDYIRLIESVIDEWKDCTKNRLDEMLAEIDV
jgi:hypothetical protein